MTGRSPRPWSKSHLHPRYLRGFCYDFALAMRELLPDGEMVCLGPFTRAGANHVGLRWRGLYLDIRGALEEDEFRDGHSIHQASLQDVLLQAGLAGQEQPWRSPDMAAARRVARAMLADLGLSKVNRPRAAALARTS